MDKLLYFDFCALAIIIILILSTSYRGLTKGRVNRTLFAIMMLCMFTITADIFAVWLDNLGEGNRIQKYLFHSIYLLIHNVNAPLYMIYLTILSDTDHLMKGIRRFIFSIPFSVVFVLLAFNPIHKKVFYLDAKDAYTRGDWFIILYVVAAIYFGYGINQLFRYRKLYTRNEFAALFAVFPFTIIAMMIQMIVPQLLLEMFANALGLLAMTTMVQKAEDYIETDTGFGKKSAYVKAIERAERNKKPTNVIMVAITNYSALHRMLGYMGMRELLKHISDNLQSFNQANRYGAEIYYLGMGKFNLIVDYRNLNKTDKLAEEINEIMQTDHDINGMEINLIPLVCVARFMQDIKSSASLIAFGDDLSSKHYTGKVVYAADIYQENKYDIMGRIDSIIESALSGHKFEVYYQPIYSVNGKYFNSAEALLRLKDDKCGFISPEIFIPAAEKTGAIHKIGSYVLEEVCSFIASEEFKKLKVDYIEVNLSVVQCMRNELDSEILEIMNRYGVKAGQLNLEITETAASYSQNALMDNIESLTSKGISFSLDDFGTGYSNMRRIASMPFDIVKLDKSFTNVEHNPRMKIVLENTIRMIKDMNMKIVVEGVETKELVDGFADLKCEYIQGYYFSKPVPKDEFVEFIEKNNLQTA